jgi:hypothetical protein
VPHPYVPREGANLETGHRILERRPACAVKIATVAAAWAEVEFHLAMLLGHATTAEMRTVGGGEFALATITKANPISIAAMEALESLSARLNVIQAVLAVSVSPDRCKEFDALAPTVRSAAVLRNRVVHARWYITDSYLDDVLAVTADPNRFDRYTPKNLDWTIDQIFDVRRKVGEFGVVCLADLIHARKAEP